MAKSNWVEELKRQMSAAAPDSVPVPVPTPVPSVKPKVATNESWTTLFLLMATVALGAFVYFALQYHVNKNVVPNAQSQQVDPTDVAPVEPIKSDPQTDPNLEALKNTVSGLSTKQKELEHRVWVLGVLNNNNFGGLQQSMPNADLGLVYIQSNWSVDRIPAKLKLTDEQKQALGNPPTTGLQ